MTPTRPDTDTRPSRRDVLGATGAALTTASTALAGCMSTLPPLGQRVRFGRVDVPSRAQPVYRDWMPQPGTIETDEDTVDPLTRSMYAMPGDTGHEIVDAGNTLGEAVMRAQVDYFGHGFDNYDWAFDPGQGTVLAGSIDRDVVHETLTDTVYEATDTYRGFDRYRRTDEPRQVAVSDTHLVFSAGDHAASNVRRLVDTGTGRAPRYVDVDGTAAELVETAGASPFTWFGAGDVSPRSERADESVPEPGGTVLSSLYDEDAAYYVYEAIYPDGDRPSKPRVKDWAEEHTRALDAVDVDVTVGDRLVRTEMRLPADAVGDDATDPLVTPQVTWSSQYDSGENSLEVTHHAGDSVDAARLGVRLYEGTGTAELTPQSGTVGPGDTVTVDLSESNAARVDLYVQSADGDRTSTVYTTGRSEG